MLFLQAAVVGRPEVGGHMPVCCAFNSAGMKLASPAVPATGSSTLVSGLLALRGIWCLLSFVVAACPRHEHNEGELGSGPPAPTARSGPARPARYASLWYGGEYTHTLPVRSMSAGRRKHTSPGRMPVKPCTGPSRPPSGSTRGSVFSTSSAGTGTTGSASRPATGSAGVRRRWQAPAARRPGPTPRTRPTGTHGGPSPLAG